MAMGTFRKLLAGDFLGIKPLRWILVPDTECGGSVFLTDPKFHAADRVGPKPIKANEVFVGQKRVNAGRFEKAFGE